MLSPNAMHCESELILLFSKNFLNTVNLILLSSQSASSNFLSFNFLIVISFLYMYAHYIKLYDL